MIAVVYLAACSSTTETFARRWGVGFKLDQMLENEAPRPFAYRALSPSLIRFVSNLVPERVEQILLDRKDHQGYSPLERWRSNYHEYSAGFSENQTRKEKVRFFIAYCYLFSVLLAFAFAMRILIGIHVRGAPILLDIAPALMIFLLPMAYTKGGYIYDFPELLFAACGLICMSLRLWIPYYILFILAILNKETAILLGSLPIARFIVDRDKKALFTHGAAHSIIGLPIFFYIRHIYADLPTIAIFQPLEHISYFISPRCWLSFDAIFLPTIPAVPGPFNLAVISIFAWLTLGKHARKDRELFWVFVLLSSVIGIPFLFSGFEDEVRVFGLAFPAIMVLATKSFISIARATDPCTTPEQT